MTRYSYTWKQDITLASDQEVKFPQPLVKDMVFASLRTGKTFIVVSTGKAKENDRDNDQMPEDVVQTFDGRQLPEKELYMLRQQCEWVEGKPEFVILTSYM